MKENTKVDTRRLNAAGNLILLAGLLIITAALVWGAFSQEWSGWKITAALGGIVFGWGWIIVFVIYAIKTDPAS